MVYVISKSGKPLMPTNRHGKVKHLLKDGKAKVVRRTPFTIRLLYDTTEYTQDLTLGVDTGSGTIGAAVSDDDGNIYYRSEVAVRNDIAGKMKQRAKYRGNRRSRKTRYRKPRFDNRKNSTKEGRFSPTMQSKLQAHIREIEFVKTILPITRLVLETGTFDTHLMQHKDEAWNRHWGYQKGPNYGYADTKARVLNRDGYRCQYCHGKKKDSKLEVHHIVYRSRGGSDDAENLITLCHTCHEALHDGTIVLKLTGKKRGTQRYATQMNSIRKQLLIRYPEAIETFGYVTKANREAAGVAKTHAYDACFIASNGKPVTLKTNIVYRKICVPEGDYQQRKGVRSEQAIPTGKIGGFKKFDKVAYRGGEYLIKGRMTSGYAVLMNADGTKAEFTACDGYGKTPKLQDLKRVGARKSWMTISEVDTQSTA